jgi:hypothetical protein
MRGLPRAALTTLMLLLAAAAAGAAGERAAPGPAGKLLTGQPPAAGQYDAVMCVTVNTAPAQCGPVAADIGDGGLALLRVSDIAYRLQLYGDQLGISVFHGTMQIDGFFAPYQWLGNTLQFNDTEKATRYEMKLGTRRFDTP